MEATKTKKIIYWVATLWLALGMTATGIVQVMKMEEEAKVIAQLGYPAYLMTIIGIWKLLGVIAVLLPGFPLVKEWAYAGFFFVMSGAICSHIAVGDPVTTMLGPLLLIMLTVTSWYLRPASRKLSA